MAIASIPGRRLLQAAAALLGVLLFGTAAAEPSVILEGRYRGAGEAQGMAFSIAPDPGGFTGTWRGADGEQRILADRIGDIAEAVIDVDGAAALLRIAPQPYGAEAVVIPFLPDGRLDTGRGRLLPFLGEGVRSTVLPEGHAFAPLDDERGRITATAFLRSYVWWRPAGVAAGYRALAEEHRTLIRLFPAVQLDLIWKLCLAPRADGVQGQALRGAGLSCADVIEGLASAQRTGRYRAFREAVDAARGPLIEAMRCAQQEVMPRGACERSARRMAEMATALETPASLLARYR